MKYGLYILILGFFCTGVAQANDCKISKAEEKRLLAMAYDKFDQDMGKGWRKYGDQGCYTVAADLLDKYLAIHKAKLVDWQIRVMTWHAGQMFAFNNNYSLAKARFLYSTNPNEPKDTPILWNDYVYASVAFLDKDMATLKVRRDAIAKGPVDENGKVPNLNVVDSLIKCFDKPYAIAYSGCQQ